MLKIQQESLRIYKKQIFKPLTDMKRADLVKNNKKNTYTELEMNEKIIPKNLNKTDKKT